METRKEKNERTFKFVERVGLVGAIAGATLMFTAEAEPVEVADECSAEVAEEMFCANEVSVAYVPESTQMPGGAILAAGSLGIAALARHSRRQEANTPAPF